MLFSTVSALLSVFDPKAPYIVPSIWWDNNIKKNFGFVTAELVKNAVKGVGQKTVTLLALFREHNEEFKKRIGIDRIRETYLCYQRSYGYLETFVRDKRGVEDVTLRSLDKVFYDDFEIFLQSDCRLSPKTVHDHLYRLKKNDYASCQSRYIA